MLKLCLFSTDVSLMMLIKRMLIKKKRVPEVVEVVKGGADAMTGKLYFKKEMKVLVVL